MFRVSVQGFGLDFVMLSGLGLMVLVWGFVGSVKASTRVATEVSIL